MIRLYECKKGSKKYTVNCETYESAAKMVQDCKTRKITNSDFSNMQDNLGDHSETWCGVKSYEEALQYLESGYQPTVDKLKKQLKANVFGESKRFKSFNNVTGYAPVVPLAIMGVPNSMIDCKMQPIKTKVIDIYYEMTVCAGTESDNIISKGAKLIEKIFQLEQQGYRVNLHSYQGYCDSESGDLVCVKIKDASQPLDLKRISFALTHTAFFRVIGFDWYSKVPNGKYRFGYGHSLRRELSETQFDNITKKMFGEKSIVIRLEDIVNLGDFGIEEYFQRKLSK